ncbi:MAG: CPBP family intramembrane metalloprotease [Spirochaetales bacterium]|nr:CPBP family intramembrane metalloprotease [Spirochaetales bacterium]
MSPDRAIAALSSAVSPSAVAVSVIVLFTAGWAVYALLGGSGRLQERFHARFGPRLGVIRHTTFQRVLMAGCFGLVPFLVSVIVLRLDLGSFCRLPRLTRSAGLWAVLLFLAAGVGSYFNPELRKPGARYPQMRLTEWTRPLVAYNLLLWALFLVAYEFMYRGLLLYGLLPYGVGLSLTVNAALYSLTHIQKGLTETLAAAPFGLALCLLTLATGSFWTAAAIHVSLAVGNGLGAIRFRPDITLR